MTSKESLENICNGCKRNGCVHRVVNNHCVNYEDIDQDLDRLEELEKIIKIIKNKRFLTSFIAFALKCGYSLEKFNESISPFDALTEKEYALLVEEFGNENN